MKIKTLQQNSLPLLICNLFVNMYAYHEVNIFNNVLSCNKCVTLRHTCTLQYDWEIPIIINRTVQ